MISKSMTLLLLNAIFFAFIVFSKLLCFCNAILLSLVMISLTIYSQWDGNGLLMLLEFWGKNSDALKGKVIWITGASSGIGKACAIKFAEMKCRLVLTARTKNALEEVKKQCIEAGNLNPNDVMVLPFDITHDNLHVQACESVLEHFGELDILLSNAGVSQKASFETGTVDVDFEMYNVNVFGPVNLARVVTRYFLTKKEGQHLVASSISGKIGVSNSPSYCGSKFALHGTFESLRAEHGSKGIFITMLDIGPVETNIMKHVYGSTTDQRGTTERKGKLMTADRCATLISVATIYKLPEVFICNQPILTFTYIATYCTSLLQWTMNTINFGELSNKLRGFKDVEAN